MQNGALSFVLTVAVAVNAVVIVSNGGLTHSEWQPNGQRKTLSRCLCELLHEIFKVWIPQCGLAFRQIDFLAKDRLGVLKSNSTCIGYQVRGACATKDQQTLSKINV